jgi:hypothetical protein
MLVIVLAFGNMDTQAWQPAGPRLSFRMPSITSLGEPVVLEVLLENGADTRLRADFGLNGQTQFEFSHTRPDGTRQRVRPSVPTSGIAFLSLSEIQPKGRVLRKLVIDQWLDLFKEGTHSVTVSFLGDVTDLAGRAIVLDRTATFPLRVTGRNEDHLRQRCEGWLAEALTAGSEDGLVALTALRHVNDIVAVPFVEAAIQRRQWSDGFAALKRIGAPAGTAAIERLTRSDDPVVSSMAKSVLASMGRGKYDFSFVP